jgi:hypothetical protein
MSHLSTKVGAGILSLSGFFFEYSFAEELPVNSLPELPGKTFLDRGVKNPSPEVLPLIENKCFQNLSPDDQRKTVSIFLETTKTGKTCLLALLDKEAPQVSEPFLLQKDFCGGRLLETIYDISKMELHPRLSEKRGEILECLLYELKEPGSTNQGYRGVCGASMLYGLNLLYPAEYARLLQGLLSVEGKSQFLKQGAVLERAPFSLLTDDYYGRSINEHLLLSALMEYGDGDDEHYCDRCDVNYSLKNGSTDYGMSTEGQAKIYRAIYNLSDKQCVSVRLEGRKIPDWLKKNYLPGLIPASLRWSVTTGDEIDDEKHEVLDTSLKHALVGHAHSVTSSSYHMITIKDIKDGRVYFHNMQGCSNYPNGTEMQNPPRRVEDTKNGIQSMDLKEFKDRVREVIIPVINSPIPKPRIERDVTLQQITKQ